LSAELIIFDVGLFFPEIFVALLLVTSPFLLVCLNFANDFFFPNAGVSTLIYVPPLLLLDAEAT
jgi:hypothetical protein